LYDLTFKMGEFTSWQSELSCPYAWRGIAKE